MKTSESVNSARPTVDIIIVSWNNARILGNMLQSVLRNTAEPINLIVVNNGQEGSIPAVDYPHFKVLEMGGNKGWMGGVNAGIKWALENSQAPFVMWINDDVQILDHDYGWLTKMLNCFLLDGKIGAVGPTSNAIMGYQSTTYIGLPPQIEATRLSGMCFLTKKSIIKQIGMLDESLPGGDDLDYSIHLRKNGYKLCICRRTFMMHHYAITGKRVHGEYWDSRDHAEAINHALIKKHGFSHWFFTVNDIVKGKTGYDFVKSEDDLALSELKETLDMDKPLVLDLGCGGKKLHQKMTGVDIRPNGGLGVGANCNKPSSGEVTCDITDLKPFGNGSVDALLAKHILEHCLDIPKTLKEWNRVLKEGGKLVVISPDYRFCEAISCDPSHVQALTPDVLSSWFETIGGWKIIGTKQVTPGYVFSVTVEKVPIKELANAI